MVGGEDKTQVRRTRGVHTAHRGLLLVLPSLDPRSMADSSSMPSLTWRRSHPATRPLGLGGAEKNWGPLCWAQHCHGQMCFRMKFLSSISPHRWTCLLCHHGGEVTSWHLNPECSVKAGPSVTRSFLPRAEGRGRSAGSGTLSADSPRARMGSHVEGHGGFPLAGHGRPQAVASAGPPEAWLRSGGSA